MTSRVPLTLTALAAIIAIGGFAGSSTSAQQTPAAHAAATCSDFPNQAAAQRAHNTRDADGDGIYCENLPCPCSTASGSSGSAPAPTLARIKLGPSVLLGRWSQRTACQVNGPLPDRQCTPGARFKYATKAKVCRPGYSGPVRNVSAASKNKVYAAYGLSAHFNGTTGEVDHLVSLEVGGSNSRANLFPEAATPPPGSHEKDRLENRLHQEVCSGQTTLAHAQKLIATDWVTAYHSRFG
jgi:hypothetical protein